VTPARRDGAARILAGIGAVILLAGAIAAWASATLFDADAFAARTRRTLERSSALRRFVAQTLVVSLVEARQADLIAVRPILVAGAETVVGTRTFGDVFELAVRQAHRLATERPDDNVVVRANAATLLLVDTLRAVAPAAAATIPAGIEPALLRIQDVPAALALWRRAARVRRLGTLLPLAGALLWTGAVLLAADRRRIVTRLAALLAALGAVLLAGDRIGGAVAAGMGAGPIPPEVIRAAWWTWTDGLRALGWCALWAGLVVAAAGRAVAGQRQRSAWAQLRRAVGALARGPRSRPGQAAAGLAALAAGLAMLIAPRDALAAATAALGAALSYGALRVLFDLLARPAGGGAAARRGRRRAAGLAGTLATLLALGAAAYLALARPATHAGTLACNGRVEYCTRRLDQLALPTTHNAMATAADGFLLPNQERGVARQLRDGVRAFQIDAYLGSIRMDGTVRRVYTDLTEEKVRTIADAVGPELAARALTFRTVMGPPPEHARQDVYLCHNFCELGATKMSSTLRSHRRFLEQHPRDVLMVVIQDELPAERLLPVLREAGLDPYLATIDPARPLPMLEALIATGQRLIVGLEHGDLGPRIPNVFAGGLVQETPFDFRTVDALLAPDTCRPLRGRADAPLFQFNHWVTPASLNAARLVNAAAVLGERADRCRRERGLLPNLVAVDFYETGGLFAVVERLNGGG
jgi:hypothetical protein